MIEPSNTVAVWDYRLIDEYGNPAGGGSFPEMPYEDLKRELEKELSAEAFLYYRIEVRMRIATVEYWRELKYD